MKKYIQIRQGVIENGDSFSDDVIQVKKHLNSLGYYKEPSYGMTVYPDRHLFSAIKTYQKERRLTVDGKVFRDGETQDSLNKDILEQKVSARSSTFWCTVCGGPHGGVFGSVCEWCVGKGLA